MEKFATENLPYLIAVIVLALLLVGWLVYRNFKDEDEFEHGADDPKQNLDKHHHGDAE